MNDSRWRDELRNRLSGQTQWNWFFAGSGIALAVVGIIFGILALIDGGDGATSPPPAAVRTALVANPAIVQRGDSATISLIVGGDEGGVPCPPSTVVWESDIGALQISALLPDGSVDWVALEGGPTDALVVRWVAPEATLGAGNIKATLSDCARKLWVAEAVIPIVVGSPPR